MITLQRCTVYRKPPQAIQTSKLYVASRDLVFLSIHSNLQICLFFSSCTRLSTYLWATVWGKKDDNLLLIMVLSNHNIAVIYRWPHFLHFVYNYWLFIINLNLQYWYLRSTMPNVECILFHNQCWIHSGKVKTLQHILAFPEYNYWFLIKTFTDWAAQIASLKCRCFLRRHERGKWCGTFWLKMRLCTLQCVGFLGEP